MTNSTTSIALVNNTGSSDAYAYITGQDATTSAPLFIESDGQTVYYPTSPSDTGTALSTNVSISLGAAGSTTNVTIPQIAGGRIWFCVGNQLTFLLNPGPAIVEPSVTNTSDPNYEYSWDFCELFVNISMVDFACLPVALSLLNTSGATQTVEGLPSDGLSQICSQLTAEGGDWAKLIVTGSNGSNLRALSPNSARVADSSLFDGYYQSYVDSVWSKYASTSLTVDTQASWGTVTGTVQDGVLTFDGVGTFAQPSAGDVFSCSTGPFGSYPTATADEMGAIGARLAAAFNRSTLLTTADQPDGAQPAAYYQDATTNQYARILHAVSLDGLGYAFPYDDVVPSTGSDPSPAGIVNDANPQLLTITVGGYTSSSNSSSDGTKKTTDGQKKTTDGEKETEPATGGDSSGSGSGSGADKGKKNKNSDGSKQGSSKASPKTICSTFKGLFASLKSKLSKKK
ncbi:glycoside hydrolase family 64 protein [Xylariaceae sp. FL0804]|nr:glycoside hydrolase family 64 protein [Xylariaceae sp. FL0804]